MNKPVAEETSEDRDEWRVAFGPEEVDGDYVVVFRKDDLDRDSEGPQVLVTGSAMSDVQEKEDEDDDEDEDEDEDDDEGGYESFGNSTDFTYEFRNSAGKVIASVSVEDPDEYHGGWESESLGEASERAYSVVSEFADNPGYWKWDGSLGYLGYEPGEHEWLDAPEKTVLGIKRYFREGAYEQWAVVPATAGVALLMAVDDDWQRISTFKDVPAVLAEHPGLARLRPGRVTYFELAGEAAISEESLVSLLDICEEEGSDAPGQWADSCGWEDYPTWKHASRDLAPFRRLASINDMQLSWVEHKGKLVPLLADEDGFVAHEEIAATHLDFTGSSFVGWSAGNDLILLRPGLACSAPTGDALTEGGEDGFFLMDYPDQGTIEERASVIAGWLLLLNFQFYAALNLEPLDPAGTLDEEARREWELSVPTDYESSVWAPEDVTSALRAELTRRSDCYRYTAAARANPTGREAQVLHAASEPITVYDRHWYRPLQEELRE